MMRFAIVLATVLSLACDQDPLRLSERQVVGRYNLKQWEDGTTFYLVDDSTRDGPGGAIDGTVERIGWTEDFTLVWRKGQMGADGWIVLDPEKGIVAGPSASINIAVPPGFQILTAQEAWKALR